MGKHNRQAKKVYSQFLSDVTAAMLVYRTKAKKVFWEFDSLIMQNLSDILPLFCTLTWPSHHLNQNQELFMYKNFPSVFPISLFFTSNEGAIYLFLFFFIDNMRKQSFDEK